MFKLESNTLFVFFIFFIIIILVVFIFDDSATEQIDYKNRESTKPIYYRRKRILNHYDNRSYEDQDFSNYQNYQNYPNYPNEYHIYNSLIDEVEPTYF